YEEAVFTYHRHNRHRSRHDLATASARPTDKGSDRRRALIAVPRSPSYLVGIPLPGMRAVSYAQTSGQSRARPTRKPTVGCRYSGTFLLRCAERRFLAVSTQEPPRSTRARSLHLWSEPVPSWAKFV